MTAVAKPGYRFEGWTGSGSGTDQARWETTIQGAAAEFTARFEPLGLNSPLPPAVRVTEIQYHPADDQASGDWLELHNAGSESVSVIGWIFRDDNDDHDFLIPEATLEPGGYLVLCQDAAKFSRAYPSVSERIGDFEFGLGNSGDSIRLFDPAGNPILKLEFDDAPPWPSEADGSGRTLQLVADSAFSDPQSWAASPSPGGSPGEANP
jgi:uncharacterized repeat protein (TIGR02543 family)